MEIKVKDRAYITIQSFMVNELKLKGNELLVYAIIYGFSQADGQTFSGNLQYLANWTSSTKQGVIKNLKSLIDKGFIVKKENYINGVKFCEYYSTEFNGVLNIVEQGIKLSLPNNIKDNIIYNTKENNNTNVLLKEKEKFVPPTIDEIKAYCKERKNKVNAQTFFDYYDVNDWKDKDGKKVKNWKQRIISWEKNNYAKGEEQLSIEEQFARMGILTD